MANKKVREVVINRCFGGFSLSPRAVQRLAELNGRSCYFYVTGSKPDGSMDIHKHKPATIEEAEAAFMFFAFDVPNIDDVMPPAEHDADGTYKTYNAAYAAHKLGDSDIERDDPKLIQVVRELGSGHRTGASGKCAHLAIVEIPADVEWQIEEYDGNEHIAQKHETWR